MAMFYSTPGPLGSHSLLPALKELNRACCCCPTSLSLSDQARPPPASSRLLFDPWVRWLLNWRVTAPSVPVSSHISMTLLLSSLTFSPSRSEGQRPCSRMLRETSCVEQCKRYPWRYSYACRNVIYTNLKKWTCERNMVSPYQIKHIRHNEV